AYVYTICQPDNCIAPNSDNTSVDGHQDAKGHQYTTYTKSEVQQLVPNLIDNALASLDTLNEQAHALADAIFFEYHSKIR
ncbi:MAG: hypothetical protein ACKPKO_05995, partial [Candidatus Fonsibacter sp.]